MEYGNKVQVLMLDDCKHEPYFVTRNEYFSNPIEMIKKLREPHGRIYEFRSVCLDDLEKWEMGYAWCTVSTSHIPRHPFDPNYNNFCQAFDLLWQAGSEV